MPDPHDRHPDTMSLPESLPESPMKLVKLWCEEAERLDVQPNPSAMSLAVVDPDGSPSVRIVLCKKIDRERGSFDFYTNYDSRKGKALTAHPYAGVCFHWDDLNLQIRAVGPVTRVPDEECDAYFASRSLISRVGAAASRQSQPIASHDDFMQQVVEKATDLGVGLTELWSGAASVSVPRPANWGGFRIHAEEIELWVGGDGRLHDRAVWQRAVSVADDTGIEYGSWRATRLQP